MAGGCCGSGGGTRSPRTSLTSVQCEPLPVKPSGQGPQRAPLAVSEQTTPGKQESGAHKDRGRTVRPGVRAGCIPAGGWELEPRPGGGARVGHAPVPEWMGRGGAGQGPARPPGPRVSESQRLLAPSALQVPTASVCPPRPPLHLSPAPSVPAGLAPSVPAPHPLSSTRPVSAVATVAAALTARVALHHRVLQERDLLDLRGGGSAGIVPAPPRPLDPRSWDPGPPPSPIPPQHPHPQHLLPTHSSQASFCPPAPAPQTPHLLPEQLAHVPQRRVRVLQFAQHLRTQVSACGPGRGSVGRVPSHPHPGHHGGPAPPVPALLPALSTLLPAVLPARAPRSQRSSLPRIHRVPCPLPNETCPWPAAPRAPSKSNRTQAVAWAMAGAQDEGRCSVCAGAAAPIYARDARPCPARRKVNKWRCCTPDRAPPTRLERPGRAGGSTERNHGRGGRGPSPHTLLTSQCGVQPGA